MNILYIPAVWSACEGKVAMTQNWDYLLTDDTKVNIDALKGHTLNLEDYNTVLKNNLYQESFIMGEFSVLNMFNM